MISLHATGYGATGSHFLAVSISPSGRQGVCRVRSCVVECYHKRCRERELEISRSRSDLPWLRRSCRSVERTAAMHGRPPCRPDRLEMASQFSVSPEQATLSGLEDSSLLCALCQSSGEFTYRGWGGWGGAQLSSPEPLNLAKEQMLCTEKAGAAIKLYRGI